MSTTAAQREETITPAIDSAFRPPFPTAGKLSFPVVYSLLRRWLAWHGAHAQDTAHAASILQNLRHRLASGETLFLAGINAYEHNSGVGLVQASRENGITLVCNEEEERHRSIKHFSGYPAESIDIVKARLAEFGVSPEQIGGIGSGYNVAVALPFVIRTMVEHLPESLALLLPHASDSSYIFSGFQFAQVPRQIERQLGMHARPEILLLNHHDNHAAFSYAVSPFNDSPEPVVIGVLDGYGDCEAISLHIGRDGKLERVWSNDSFVDSLGLFYSIISSTQGGWTPLSSEGRYMGAAAWGDSDRSTNPFYRGLKEMFYFSDDGGIHLNRKLANWHAGGERRPYSRRLEKLLGPPISRTMMWNPDAVLSVDDIQHSKTTQEKVDKAAATQLVLEDAMFHFVEHALRKTRSDKLILTGGIALNCVCNMKLLDRFDNAWYRRNCGRDTRLHLWVPPTPGDAGIPIGAAYNLALKIGARPSQPLDHAFYCGYAPAVADLRDALSGNTEIGHFEFNGLDLTRVADFVAFALGRDAVLGICQGLAETGPRALGHRSILANPCNARTLDVINRLVKHREPIRPLAPIATLRAAQELFYLSEGAEARDFNAYNFMTLTVRAKPDAFRRVPAVIHRDGTARLQIVRPAADPFTYSILEAMGRRMGVEVAVNTSLNVGSPIVQTVKQALTAMQRSRGMSGLVIVAEGRSFLAWHAVEGPVKDYGRTIRALHREWISTSDCRY